MTAGARSAKPFIPIPMCLGGCGYWWFNCACPEPWDDAMHTEQEQP